MWLLRLAELNCVTTKIRSRLELRQFEMGTSTSRYFPASGTAGLARSRVSGKSRVPAPPPRMTASTRSMSGAQGNPRGPSARTYPLRGRESIRPDRGASSTPAADQHEQVDARNSVAVQSPSRLRLASDGPKASARFAVRGVAPDRLAKRGHCGGGVPFHQADIAAEDVHPRGVGKHLLVES